ncbi:condensation domain-containing protein, partial [Streptomyces sodiiphilus]|uniref:condensation domain-containing protein n=1 Tax=Streptomyces sodiiphilus TaxID=226217 RepID=UPI0031D04A0D
MWPLSPLQSGLYFHGVLSEGGVDVYQMQTVLELGGVVRLEDLRAACGGVLARHAGLRVGFVQVSSGRVVQVVPRRVEVPWEVVDLSGVPEGERGGAVDRFLERDQERRFVLSEAPLVRFAVLRLSERRHVFVMTAHHVILDGWSLPLVLRDIFALYGSRGALPRAAQYGDFLGWLEGQDRGAAERAWREALEGVEGPTLVAPGVGEGEGGLPERVVVCLPREVTGDLAAMARGRGLTLNSVVQGAWALLLAGMTGRGDVVFGATVSGRPPELAGVEEIVGLLINTVPVRVRLDPAEPLAGLLERIQREQSALAPHQYLGLSDIHRLAGHPQLFDTTTVFE